MSGLGTESNRLIDAINSYDNTLRPAVDDLINELGLVEPITLPQLNLLTTKQLGQFLEGMGDILKTLGQEVGRRSFEDNLSDMGYATVQDAIDDVLNLFAGNTATEIANTLTRIKADAEYADSLLTPPLLLSLSSIVVDVKNRNKETSLNVHSVVI